MSEDLTKHVARHVSAIPKSGIRDFFELVQGCPEVISLGVGEPDFATPWHIREAAIYSLEKGRTTYTSNLGLMELRNKIAEYADKHFDVRYDPKTEILVTVGVSEAMDLALRALLNPGDEVIYHEPCYVSYHPGITLAHGVPVAVPTRAEDDFALRASDVAAKVTDRTRVILLNFPTNPTGARLPFAELEGIAEVAVKNDLIVISDDIYSELIYTDEPHRTIASLPGMRERTILLHGFSKAFAMTGLRLGYACAPAILTDAMMKIHQFSMLCASITSQDAAIEALENGLPEMEKMRRSYARRRRLVLRRFEEMSLPCFAPGGAFYVFPDIRGTGKSSHEFAIGLLKEKQVAAVPGNAFGTGGEGFLRCCYATAESELKEALNRIEEYLQTL